MATDAATESPEATLPSRGVMRREVILVLALSLGASAVSAVISFLGAITARQALSHQTATIVSDAAPGREWLGLAWQIFSIVTALVPVALVAHLLSVRGESMRGTLGFTWLPRRLDWARGACVAAVIGGAGLALYIGARAAGFELNVVPADLPSVWWRIPVLVAAAIENAVLEETIVLGYLTHRLGQLGWSPRRADAASALLRGSYHLYQGIGGFVGNLIMGLIFCRLFRRWNRVTPMAVAHSLIDTVAFVGSVALIGHVWFLPK